MTLDYFHPHNGSFNFVYHLIRPNNDPSICHQRFFIFSACQSSLSQISVLIHRSCCIPNRNYKHSTEHLAIKENYTTVKKPVVFLIKALLAYIVQIQPDILCIDIQALCNEENILALAARRHETHISELMLAYKD